VAARKLEATSKRREQLKEGALTLRVSVTTRAVAALSVLITVSVGGMAAQSDPFPQLSAVTPRLQEMHPELATQRTALSTAMAGFNSKATQFNTDCGSIDPDNSAKISNCENQLKQLQAEKNTIESDIGSFNASVAQLMASSAYLHPEHPIVDTDERLKDSVADCPASGCGTGQDGLAKHQLKALAANPNLAPCIFDGRPCPNTVDLVQLDAGSEEIPPDAANYIRSISKSVRENPAVNREVALYEHMASVRARLQNGMVRDVATWKAAPEDETLKMRVESDNAKLNIARKDETSAKARVNFSIAKFNQGSDAKSGEPSKPTAKNGSN